MNNIKNIKNEDAVSPVIGVILMVVITVILAAVLAVFAFGVGTPTKAPQTQLKFTPLVAELGVSHAGGDTLLNKNTFITVTNAETPATIYRTKFAFGTGSFAPGDTLTPITWSTPPTAGLLIRIQVLDSITGQMITDTKVTVQ